MPNVTVSGPSGSVFTIPVNSSAAAARAQSALNTVSAAIAGNPGSVSIFTGTVPSSATALEFTGTTNAATIAGGIGALLANATGVTSITSGQATAATVVAGTGGLTFIQTAASVAGSLIVAGGGSSAISLAAGANTVSLDITPTATTAGGVAAGTATLNAFGGGADLILNATTNNGQTADDAIVGIAGDDSLVIDGSAFVYVADATNAVTIGAGGAGFFAGVPVGMTMAPGNETVGVLTGDTVSVTGTDDQLFANNTIFVAGAQAIQGSTFINANSQDVIIFPGAGTTTLFGGMGSDIAIDVAGLVEAGGASLVISAQSITGAVTTLMGGNGSYMFAQSANVSLVGGDNSATMDAAGETIGAGDAIIGAVTQAGPIGPVFSIAASPGGDTLNAGASHALMYGTPFGSTTVISGTGEATVVGHAGYTGAPGNTYLDGAAGGSMTIMDFQAADVFRLTGSQSVASAATTGFQTALTLSDGTKITVFSGVLTASNIGTYFQS